MAEEHYWYYMDSTGQEFGPYPSSTMKGWFQQGFFPMQGELQVRLSGHEEHHYIKELYPEPIMERAFDGPPNMPGNRGGGRGGGRNNRSGGGGRPAAGPPVDPMGGLGSPYDGGLGLWAGMMPGAMQSPGMSPFGFPPIRGMMPGMMPGMGGGMAMPMVGGAGSGRFQGRIKSFNVQKGFGFIECPEAHQIYGRDVFLHKAQIGDFEIGRLVVFSVEMNKNNMPQARDLMEADPLGVGFGGGFGYPGMGMTGGKGGSNTKGAGKGKGRGGGKGGPKAGAKKKDGGGDNKKSSNAGAGGQPKAVPSPAPKSVPVPVPQPEVA